MDIQENIPLAPLTTFRIGGPAKFFARVSNEVELEEALAFAAARSLDIFFLGGGSNLLVSDEGFDGLVIKIEIMSVLREGDAYVAGAGESWDALCERTGTDGLWGIENLSGIPGTVGGAVVQNIGAYGAALSQTLEWVDVYDTHARAVRRLGAAELSLGYRDSIFKKEDGRYAVLRAKLALLSRAAPNTSYRDLSERFAGHIPSLKEMREAVLSIRAAKFPDLAKEGTAGSYFKNPIVPQEEAERLAARYPGLPLFAMPEARGSKLPIAWILDHALGVRGYRLGEARLFERQPLVIAATRSARASDVRALAAFVKKKIKEETGIDIEEEVRAL